MEEKKATPRRTKQEVEPKKPKSEGIEFKVTLITEKKLIGVTEHGHGYSILRTEENKDVQIGDTVIWK